MATLQVQAVEALHLAVASVSTVGRIDVRLHVAKEPEITAEHSGPGTRLAREKADTAAMCELKSATGW